MKSIVIHPFDLDINYSVTENVAEFDALAKRDGACHDEAVSNILYRTSFADIRDEVCDKLEKETGLERKTKVVRTKKDADGKDVDVLAWDETESVYVKRVVANKVSGGESEESVKAWLTAIVQAVADATPFNPAARERKAAGPRKVPEKVLAAAKKLFEAGRGAEVAAKIAAAWSITTDGSTVEALAAAIHEDQKRKAAALEGQY